MKTKIFCIITYLYVSAKNLQIWLGTRWNPVFSGPFPLSAPSWRIYHLTLCCQRKNTDFNGNRRKHVKTLYQNVKPKFFGSITGVKLMWTRFKIAFVTLYRVLPMESVRKLNWTDCRLTQGPHVFVQLLKLVSLAFFFKLKYVTRSGFRRLSLKQLSTNEHAMSLNASSITCDKAKTFAWQWQNGQG